MKTMRILLLLLACIIGTTACGNKTPSDTLPSGTTVTEESTKREEETTKANKDETVEKATDETTVEPTTESAAELTSFEAEIREAGGRMLPPEDMEKWNDYFDDPLIAPFLSSEYEYPAGIGLISFMHFDIKQLKNGEAELCSREEEKLLQSRYSERNWTLTRIVKNTVQSFDEVLMQCMGITMQDTQKKGLDKCCYLEEYDAFYYLAGDGGFGQIVPSEAAVMPDGSIVIHWKEAGNAWGAMEGILKLKAEGDKWLIQSNKWYRK